MGRAYARELTRLPATAEFARYADISTLTTLLEEMASRSLIFVGSGGSLTAATLAARLHEYHTGRLTKALTPLEAATRPPTSNTAAVLISARGSNPDIIKAFRALRFQDPIAAICATKENTLLKQITKAGTGIGYGFAVPGGRDGFLATNSLLATLILIARGYSSIFGHASIDLEDIGKPQFGWQQGSHIDGDLVRLANAETIIALSSGWAWTAAVDLESKCSESGIANVQLSDFRNFAHGRHNWLRTRATSTAVVSIEDKSNSRLAESILTLLPDDVQKVRLISDKKGPCAAIDLVCHVFHLIGSLGAELGMDPGQPVVEKFGRKMYRKGLGATNQRTPRETWIARKANAIGIPPNGSHDFLATALDSYLERIRRTPIKAVIADYDGTLCGAHERHGVPRTEVRRLLNSLLHDGLILAVATGRGRSAHEALRRVISQQYWNSVLVGLYNGAVIVPLSVHPNEPSGEAPHLVGARDTIHPLLNQLPIEVSYNSYQLSVRPCARLNLESLYRSIAELLSDTTLPITIRKSAHSVDIFGKPTTKALLARELERFEGVDSSSTLRIGDLGDWGGNDFDLLNEGLSLSVDRISSSLNHCWNLGPPGSKGVKTTVHYLDCLSHNGREFSLSVRDLARRGN